MCNPSSYNLKGQTTHLNVLEKSSILIFSQDFPLAWCRAKLSAQLIFYRPAIKQIDMQNHLTSSQLNVL